MGPTTHCQEGRSIPGVPTACLLVRFFHLMLILLAKPKRSLLF
jgi:hypothetical protein